MNTSFISDHDIDRVLGRIGEQKPIDRFNISEEDKTKLRAEYVRKKAQQYAINPGLIYSEEKEFMQRPVLSRSKNIRTFTNTMHNAGIVRRTYAFFTDLCIVGLVLVAFVYTSVLFFGADNFAQARMYSSASNNIVVWLGALYAFLFVAYMVYFEGTMGQTLGKMFLNVKLVTDKYERPTMWTVLVRTLLFLILPVGLLGVHNFITRTRLVNLG